MKDRIHYDSVFGGSNPSDIATGTNTPVPCITISNDLGKNFVVKGFVLRYEPGLESCVAELFYNNNIKFITGDNQLTSLGNSKTDQVPRDEFPVDIPFGRNSKVVLSLNPKGLLIHKGDITLTLLASDEESR